jgi:hypothetical protein
VRTPRCSISIVAGVVEPVVRDERFGGSGTRGPLRRQSVDVSSRMVFACGPFIAAMNQRRPLRRAHTAASPISDGGSMAGGSRRQGIR